MIDIEARIERLRRISHAGNEPERRAAAMKKLEQRCELYADKKPVDNAGSPMFYDCDLCNATIEMPEDWIPPRPTLCIECSMMKVWGYLDRADKAGCA